MKLLLSIVFTGILSIYSTLASAQSGSTDSVEKRLYIDVHYLPPGKIRFADVDAAHKKDIATQAKYGVEFLKYWVDEEKGLVYCLSSCKDSSSIRKTHREAHGLVPGEIFEVQSGEEALATGDGSFFLDIHELGAGKVTAENVAGAHQKDLDVQKKHGVSFINYWVDEKKGIVMCLSRAKDAASVISTHKEAHGLLPNRVLKVKQGQ
jgi:hypothetical protein